MLERVGGNAYKIELPKDYGVSPTFNVADSSLWWEWFRLKDSFFATMGDWHRSWRVEDYMMCGGLSFKPLMNLSVLITKEETWQWLKKLKSFAFWFI